MKYYELRGVTIKSKLLTQRTILIEDYISITQLARRMVGHGHEILVDAWAYTYLPDDNYKTQGQTNEPNQSSRLFNLLSIGSKMLPFRLKFKS